MSVLMRDLYLARQASRTAKEKFKQAVIDLGTCEDQGEGDGYGCKQGPCYYRNTHPSELCGVCSKTQPLWEDYQVKSRKAGTALRAVLREGKRIQLSTGNSNNKST